METGNPIRAAPIAAVLVARSAPAGAPSATADTVAYLLNRTVPLGYNLIDADAAPASMHGNFGNLAVVNELCPC